MSRVINALKWDGVYTTIGLYAVFPAGFSPKEIDFSYQGTAPRKAVHPYILEDEESVLNGRITILFEVQLSDIPNNLGEYLKHCLEKASSEGAQLSWLAFDGSFDFKHLFTEDIANQIYGLQYGREQALFALSDEQLQSFRWVESIAKVRERLLSISPRPN